MKKILVLGGNGFIGTNLCSYLNRQGYHVFSMDIREPQHPIEGVQYIVGDFFDDVFLQEIIEDKDVVYHAISTIMPGNSNQKYMSGYSRDLLQTVKLCSYLQNTKIRMIFLSSGGTVYGNQKEQPIREDALPVPINHYGNVKLCIEHTIKVFNMQMHTKMLVARISNPYGPLQDYQKGVGFIDAVLKRAMHHEVVSVWGDGETVRDYIYIDDVCKMLAALIEYEGPEEIFNVSSSQGTSQKQILNIVKKMEPGLQVEYTKARSVDAKKIILDNQKIQKECGKFSIIPIEEGIEKYYNYLRGEKIF